MGRLEGVIILAADGRPIVHSHFTNAVAAYPLLHSDRLAAALAAIDAAVAQLENKPPQQDATYFAKDVKPVLWVDGIPELVEDDQESEDEEDSENEERAVVATEEKNVWSDTAATIAKPAPAPAQAQAVARGAQVVAQAHEALAEQGAALCHLQSGTLRFLCPVSKEVDPLVPLCFLRAFVGILHEYLAPGAALSEDAIRDNFDVVYQLFEEVLDKDGNVLTTEVNTLKSLVLPPSWVAKIVKAVGVGGLASAAPPPLVGPVPWRRAGAKYTNNEMYVDLVASLEGVIARNGRPVMLEMWATLACNAKLSGTPDLTLSFNQPALVQDPSFHPCVRHRRWSKDKVLSFIPPDGEFELASFRIGAPHAVPLGLGKMPSPLNGWGRDVPISIEAEFDAAARTFSVQVVSELPSSQAVEDVLITFGLGPGTQSLDATVGGGTSTRMTSVASSSTAPTSSTFIWDQDAKVVRWSIPSLCSSDRPPLLTGTWTHSTSVPSSLTATFLLSAPLSPLRVTALTLTSHKPFKGVKTLTRGRLDFRI